MSKFSHFAVFLTQFACETRNLIKEVVSSFKINQENWVHVLKGIIVLEYRFQLFVQLTLVWHQNTIAINGMTVKVRHILQMRKTEICLNH